MSSESNQPSETQTWDDPRITAYVLDELPTQARTLFEEEMENNAALAAAVEEARSITGDLERFYEQHADSIDGLDPSRRNAIFAESESPSTVSASQTKESSSWLRRHGIALCVAVSLCFVLATLMVPPVQRAREATTMVDESASFQADYFTPDGNADLSMSDDSYEMFEDRSSTIATANSAILENDSTLFESRPQPQGMRQQDLAIVPSSERGQIQQPSDGETVSRPVSGLESLVDQESEEQRESPHPFAKPESLSRNNARGEVAGASAYRAQLSDVATIDRDAAKKNEASMFAPVAEAPADAFGLDGLDVSAPQTVDRLAVSATTGRPSQSQVSKEVRAEIRAIPAPRGAVVKSMPEALLEASRGPGGVQKSKLIASELKRGGDRRESIRLFVEPHIAPYEPEASPLGLGTGPSFSGDKFDPVEDNPFKRVSEHPLSTFSVDVDTASYSKVRGILSQDRLPSPSAVRIEEMMNYFEYTYHTPNEKDEAPFATDVAVMDCPWNEGHLLARIAIQGKAVQQDSRPPCNLVFLLDTSGSMNQPNKLPLVVEGMKMLLRQLGEKDRVAIVTYAGSPGLVLDSTKASKSKKIRRALTQLSAGGSTNGGAGISLAYQTARDHFIEDGVNRVILCTDGDFNVGTTSTGDLVTMVERESKGGIFLTALGFGMGNHNDAMMEKISGRGNGNYAFIDTKQEAKKVLVQQTNSTLVTIAKDVKLQLEFNPNEVAKYRLIGYENRILAKEDFNDDKKDAGEIGAGHQVTALYQIVPVGKTADSIAPSVDPLKYQSPSESTAAAKSGELLTLKLRYKAPDGDTSRLIEFVVKKDLRTSFADADADARFAAAVAGFGMQLRRSSHVGTWTPADVVATAKAARGEDPHGFRSEFIQLAKTVVELMGGEAR